MSVSCQFYAFSLKLVDMEFPIVGETCKLPLFGGVFTSRVRYEDPLWVLFETCISIFTSDKESMMLLVVGFGEILSLEL